MTFSLNYLTTITTNIRAELRPMEVDYLMLRSKDGHDDDKNLLLYGHCSCIKDNPMMVEAEVGLAESCVKEA